MVAGVGDQNPMIAPGALGVAHMYAAAHGVDVADLQAQSFAQPQTETVEGEEEQPVLARVLRGL